MKALSPNHWTAREFPALLVLEQVALTLLLRRSKGAAAGPLGSPVPQFPGLPALSVGKGWELLGGKPLVWNQHSPRSCRHAQPVTMATSAILASLSPCDF